jgi:hypothetical protein
MVVIYCRLYAVQETEHEFVNLIGRFQRQEVRYVWEPAHLNVGKVARFNRSTQEDQPLIRYRRAWFFTCAVSSGKYSSCSLPLYKASEPSCLSGIPPKKWNA